MPLIKYTLVPATHLSQILFFMSHHRTDQILAIFSSDKQKHFFQFLITNLKNAYTNIQCQTFQSVINNSQLVKDKVCLIMDVPVKFQIMGDLYKVLFGFGGKSLSTTSKAKQVILILLEQNKKYINMIKKKLQNDSKQQSQKLEYVCSQYSANKLVGINKKIAELIDQSYDLNRAAFYAYGAYINNFKDNLLKFIFQTQALDVAGLAKSYGFSTPPRVKQGSFLKLEVRKKKIRSKLIQKKKNKKLKQIRAQQESDNKLKEQKRVKSYEKIKDLAAKKTKLIMKDKNKLKSITKTNIDKNSKNNKSETNMPKKKKVTN